LQPTMRVRQLPLRGGVTAEANLGDGFAADVYEVPEDAAMVAFKVTGTDFEPVISLLGIPTSDPTRSNEKAFDADSGKTCHPRVVYPFSDLNGASAKRLFIVTARPNMTTDSPTKGALKATTSGNYTIEVRKMKNIDHDPFDIAAQGYKPKALDPACKQSP